MTLSDLERQDVSGQIFQADPLNYACTVRPRTTKFGRVVHVWEGHNFRGQHQEDPLAVHCFCVCSGSALLGNLLGVSISTPGNATFRLSCRFIFGFSCANSLCIIV